MKKHFLSQGVLVALLLVFAVLTLFPFYIMFVTSLKSQIEFATNFWGFAANPVWGNYAKAWAAVSKYIFNSFYITIITTLGVVIVAVLAGFAFAKLRFRFQEAIYGVLLAFNMIPAALLLVPMFMNVLKMGLNDTRWGVILPSIAMSAIMPVILSRGFFESIPDSLFEAARIDGAGELQVVWRIVVPLSKPIIGTVSLFTFFGVFNNFMWPYVVLSSDALKTIPIGLNKLTGQFGVDFGLQMAAYSLVSIPLVVLIASTMKIYLRGITAGAVKA